jgi:hypothetical protein
MADSFHPDRLTRLNLALQRRKVAKQKKEKKQERPLTAPRFVAVPPKKGWKRGSFHLLSLFSFGFFATLRVCVTRFYY